MYSSIHLTFMDLCTQLFSCQYDRLVPFNSIPAENYYDIAPVNPRLSAECFHRAVFSPMCFCLGCPMEWHTTHTNTTQTHESCRRANFGMKRSCYLSILQIVFNRNSITHFIYLRSNFCTTIITCGFAVKISTRGFLPSPIDMKALLPLLYLPCVSPLNNLFYCLPDQIILAFRPTVLQSSLPRHRIKIRTNS